MESKTDSLDDLDKFKRRMIRTVGRLLVKEKQPENEVFKKMKQETGIDCKVLWDRMCSLTVKKLQRLLNADDKSFAIASVGRMSLTDWLLFDLVIVHENIDVIGQEDMLLKKKDRKPLLDLFVLVQRFNIEAPSGDDSLAEKWTAATIHYNSQGHQCSPMLMQRRWYQLKSFTREVFYNFWFAYRGNSGLLAKASEQGPTKLQRAIARRFPHIIVQPFVSWEEMIKQNLVIMPDVFEYKMKQTLLPKPVAENSPDVMIVEPEVETIDLSDESDSAKEESNDVKINKGPDKTQSEINSLETLQIKSEQIDKDLEEYYFTKDDNLYEREKAVIASIAKAELALDNEKLYNSLNEEDAETIPQVNETSNVKVVSVTEATTDGSISAGINKSYEDNSENGVDIQGFGVTLPQIINVTGKVDMSNMSNMPSNTENETITIEDDIIIMPTENIDKEHQIEQTTISHSLNIDNITEYLKNAYENVLTKKSKPILNIQCKKAIERSIQELRTTFVPNTEVNGLEVEIAKKANEYIRKANKDANIINSHDLEIEIAEKADLFIKSRMENKVDEVITDLDFADDGVEFIDDGIEFEDPDVIITSVQEATDVNVHNVKSEENDESEVADDEVEYGDTGKFDLKLLMDPVVYTLKLDDMPVFKNETMQCVKSDKLISEIEAASKIISPKSSIIKIKEEHTVEEDKEIYDDIFRHDFYENSDEPNIDEDKRVKLTSYLLSKPKVCEYNFIQLCKNPDFNTRLKRLSAGFLSSPRNRELLKACKPMTVDMSKAFEQKMINGTLFLKDAILPLSDTSNHDYLPNNIRTRVSTIPAQSLLDGLVSNMAATDTSRMESTVKVERNTVINLPNINEVRRINQKLLTAEVTPIQLSPDNNKATTVTISNGNILNMHEVAKQVHKVTKESENPTKPEDSTIKEPQLNVMNSQLSEKKNEKKPNTAEDKEATNNSVLNLSQNLNKTKEKIRPKMQSEKRITIPWNSRIKEAMPDKYDALLTLDTLVKMISVIEGDDFIVAENEICKLKEPVKVIKDPKKKLNKNETERENPPATVSDHSKTIDKQIDPPILKANKCSKGRKRNKDTNKSEETCLKTVNENVVKKKITKIRAPKKVKTKIVNANNYSVNLNPSSVDKNNSGNYVGTEDGIRDHITSDLIYLSDDDIALNAICSTSIMSSENTNSSTLPEPLNYSQHSSISQPVNHLIVERAIVPAKSTVTCDVSTITSQSELEPNHQSIGNEPIFTVLPMPNSKREENNLLKTVENCSCQLPSMNLNKNHIVLDGSNYCITHGPQSILISKKHFEDMISGSTLKLSKDKILLSTITLPKIISKERIKDTCLNSKKIDLLPPGVQLVLPPNGLITYYLEPGVVLDDTQIAQLNRIIEAAQNQLQANIPSISATPLTLEKEVVDLTDDDDSTQISQAVLDIVSNSENEKSKESMSNTSVNEEKAANTFAEGEEQNFEIQLKNNENNDTIGQNSINITVERNIKNNENVSESISEQSKTITSAVLSSESTITSEIQIVTNNENSIPSHLPTQSKVSNNIDNEVIEIEDTVFSDLPKETDTTNTRKSILFDLMEISGIGQEDIAPVAEESSLTVPLESSNPIAIQLDGGGKLNVAPITSFNELKHAYENKAYFYELNCKTGIIQKVNVCLSKSKPVPKASNHQPPQKKNVLHLTPLNPTPENVPQNTIPEKSIKPRHTPLLLRKAQKFRSLNFKTLKHSLLKPNLTHLRKTLARSIAKLYEKKQPIATLNISDDEYDSSDDEPLIKKSKRLKEFTEKNQIVNQGSDEGMDLDGQASTGPIEVNLNANHEIVPSPGDASATSNSTNITANEGKNPILPENDQLVNEEEVLEEYLDENYIANGEEECILGV